MPWEAICHNSTETFSMPIHHVALKALFKHPQPWKRLQ